MLYFYCTVKFSPKTKLSQIMEINNLKALSNIIRTYRKSLRLTQAELAAACGVGVRFIVDLENAKETCEIGKALKIIRSLGIKLEINGIEVDYES